MARLEFEVPEDVYFFSVSLEVRYPDVNAGNHLGADKMVTMLNEARDRFFTQLDHPDCHPGRVHTLMTDIAVIYRAEVPARVLLRFDIGLMDMSKYGGDVVTRVSREDTGGVVADAKSGFVFFDPVQQKVTPVPGSFLARLQRD